MLNHVTLMGRLTRDPELRAPNGISVCSFCLAVERDFSGSDGNKETDFINCVAWRKTGEFVCKYFVKGDMLALSGRLTIRRWQSKDGQPRTGAEVVADNVYFAGSRRDPAKTRPPQPADYAPVEDDDPNFPF